MTERESYRHVTGRSHYVDDLPVPEHCLFAAVVSSPVANGTLLAIDSQQAKSQPGVVSVISAVDIPGDNQIGEIAPDEQLLAEKQLLFIGKPVALVLAESPSQARHGASCVTLSYEAAEPILDVRTAYRAGSTFGEPRCFQKGDTARAFNDAPWVVEGDVDTHAQEHLYFETQAALALPSDGNRIKLFCASQSPSAVQKFTARVLGLAMNAVEVEVPRLGGAFGGKEEQAKPWALMAALGAHISQRPVKLVLNRQEDMRWTGKRHPYSAHYRLAADKQGRLLGYEVKFLQDGGAVADLSTAILERTLFHATNAYAIPNVTVNALSCRTHHPSNTAFRGFGAPQAIFALESAIDHLALTMKMPRWEIQHKNLLTPGYTFDYGMTVKTDALQQCWQRLWDDKCLAQRFSDIETKNKTAARYKKALALTPLCFGISFTATHLNQASVNVNIYTDGSIGLATSAVEMGQGVTEKMRAVAARVFTLSIDKIRVDYTNSSKAANMPPTAASVGGDLSGMAIMHACENLKNRLRHFAAQRLNTSYENTLLKEGVFTGAKTSTSLIAWDTLIGAAYLERISLSERCFYATPDLYFDRVKEQGNPFSYHVYGVSAIECTLDSLLGVYKIDHIDVVYDLGESLDPMIDQGQMEGGLVQGVGYATMEEIVWDDNGVLLTDSFATYKIPDLLHSPEISVEFIASKSNPHGPFSAKAIGEPPFLLGLGAYFAVTDAIRSYAGETSINYQLPISPERVLLALYPDFQTEPAVDPL